MDAENIDNNKKKRSFSVLSGLHLACYLLGVYSFDHAYGRRCLKYLRQSKARFVEESSIFSFGTLITTGKHQHLDICKFTKVGFITGRNNHFAHQELPLCWHRMMNVPEEPDR